MLKIVVKKVHYVVTEIIFEVSGLDSSVFDTLDESLLCEVKCLLALFVFLKCRLRLLLSFSLLVNLLSHFENWNKVMVYFFLPKGEEHVPLTALYALLR